MTNYSSLGVGSIAYVSYVGELPNRAGRALNPKGKTVYEVKFADEVLQIFGEKDIEKASE
jgi:hypothetical protein